MSEMNIGPARAGRNTQSETAINTSAGSPILDKQQPRSPGTLTDLQKLDYEQTLETYRQLVDIRFKLLAFIPTLTGVAVTVLTTAGLAPLSKFTLALAGFAVTLGVLLYELRNTQFHDGAYGRLRHLEERLGMPTFGTDKHPGLIGSRLDQPPRTFFSLPAKHDPALWLIYSAALAAWAFAAVDGLDASSGVSLVVAAVVWVSVLIRLATLRTSGA